ncbi:MAG TPA: MarR family transcriptional regulator [Streptosporangiaceae bacterium]|nr:MarR family transcriptional regulator [Streptosporangiaceae bacterium]
MTGSEEAARAWQAMRTLVLDNDRRREVSDALGLSFIRAKALRRLAEGPTTLRELATALIVDAPYTTVMVDDLERRGLVVRTAHPTDRRAKVVTVTPEGAAAAALADQILGRPPEALLTLDPNDLAALSRIITTLLPY